ncbi:hypothetical protein, partial [Micromonospora sp. AMSO1212t]
WPLAGLRATIEEAERVRITDHHGVREIGSLRSGPLAPGDSVQGWVAVSGQPSEAVTVKVVCAGNPPEQWTVFPRLAVFPEYEGRRPEVDINVEWERHSLRMRMTLTSPEPLASIEARMLDPEGFLFTSRNGEARSKAMRCGSLRQGGSGDFWLVKVSGV